MPSLTDATARPPKDATIVRAGGEPASKVVPRHKLTERQEEANTFLAKPGVHKALYGGSRSGKTFLFTRALTTRALRGKGSRHATLRLRANAVRAAWVLDTFPKVMRLCFPEVAYEEHRMDGFFSFPHNDAEIWYGGLDDKERVEKILGQEYATIFLNECSQIPYESVIIARTRLAQKIESLSLRMYYDLNPPGKLHWSNWEFGQKKNPVSKQPLRNPEEFDRMQMNPASNIENLAPGYLEMLEGLPEKQRRRFLLGEYIDEVDNALWTYDRLDAVRINADSIPPMRRIVVSVDPSGAAGEESERSDLIGINVSGQSYDGRAYVLEDLTCRLGPSGWARVAVTAYHRWMADTIVAETNYGGAMVVNTIRTVDPLVPVKIVTASRGKAIRAEPVATLYDEAVDMVRHAGTFPELEDELCSFSSAGFLGEKSPNRADALVWALTELMIGAGKPQLLFG